MDLKLKLKLTLTISTILSCSACEQAFDHFKTPASSSLSVTEKNTSSYQILPIKNPGFEASSDRVVGWNSSQHAGIKAYEMSVDTTTAAEGKNSFRIKRIAKQAWGKVSQRLPLQKEVGKQVVLTAKVKGDNLGERGFVVMLVFRQMGGGYIDILESKPLKGTSEWQVISLSGPIPPKTAQIEVASALKDEGTAWFDDIRVAVKNK